MGIVVMVIAGFSFLAAGVMLLIRLAILVLLMIFSPVFFIGMVFPQVSKYAGQWKEALIGQCIFAPLYMALMYVVLRIILDPGFGAFLGVDNKSTFVADLVAGKSVSTVLQYILVIIMINMGLVAAKSFAGKAGEWGGQFSDWAKKGLSKYTYGIAAQQTIGRFGSDLEKRFADSSLGNTHFGRAIRASTSGALANKNFGGAGSYSDYKKTDKEVKSKERMIQRKRELEVAISSGVSKNVKDALRNMTDSEIAGLDKKFFTDPAYANLVIPHLSSSTYKKVLDGERSEDDKQAISAERKKSFTDFAKTGNHTEISKMLKGMSKEESIEFIEDGIRDRLSSGVGPGDRTLRELVKKINPDNVGDIDKTLITNLDVAEHMNFKQLQGLESSLSDSERRSLGNSIGTRPHAVSYDSIIDPRNMGHWT
jgi:hypothetical protein